MEESGISRLKRDIVFDVQLQGRKVVFHSTWGLFSPRRMDDGSYMLLHHITPGADDVTLDIGCGYGALGVAIAQMCPSGSVHMVDKDYVAVDFARKSASANGLSNCKVYLSNAFSDVGETLFDNIVSNLPAKVGKELLSIILHDAKRHLKPNGRLVVVTVTGLRKFIRRNFEEVFGNYEKLKQGKHYTVAQALLQA